MALAESNVKIFNTKMIAFNGLWFLKFPVIAYIQPLHASGSDLNYDIQ